MSQAIIPLVALGGAVIGVSLVFSGSGAKAFNAPKQNQLQRRNSDLASGIGGTGEKEQGAVARRLTKSEGHAGTGTSGVKEMVRRRESQNTA